MSSLKPDGKTNWKNQLVKPAKNSSAFELRGNLSGFSECKL